MATDFSRTLSLLRQEKGVSQRKAAAELGISQALLSHYENGIREPGLAFVTRACDYYHVSADYLLGRTLSRDGSIIEAGDVYDSSGEKGSLRGSIMATLQKKLVVNTAGVLFDQLGKTGSREAVTAAGDYLSGALYALLREGGEVACLIKPQFEAGREKVGKKGVVRDPKVHLEVLENFLMHAKENDFTVLGITYSPIRGPEGNIEYLGYLRKSAEEDRIPDLRALVDASHTELKEGHGEE